MWLKSLQKSVKDIYNCHSNTPQRRGVSYKKDRKNIMIVYKTGGVVWKKYEKIKKYSKK